MRGRTDEKFELETIGAIANVRALEALFFELVTALSARRAINKEDLAGVFFRAGWKVSVDDSNPSDATLIAASGHLDVLRGQCWRRLLFEHESHELQGRVAEWDKAGGKGSHPAEAHEIARSAPLFHD